MILSISNGWKDYFNGLDYENDSSYSTLSKFTASVIAIHEVAMGLFVMIVNMHKRKSIVDFLKRLSEVPIQEKYKSILKSRVNFCFTYSALLWGIVTGSTFVFAFKPGIKSLILFLITMTPYFAEYTLLVVIKVLEIFFITLLEEFHESLQSQKSQSKENFLRKYQAIVNLNKEFQSAFSLVQTFTTCGLALTAAVQVS